MHKNNSWSISKPEEDLFNLLLEKFGKDDIVREYKDDRYYDINTGYRFKCDFYVKSLDLFIELNYHPTHGLHPFNEHDEDDIELLKILKENKTPWNETVVDVWFNRDVKKLNIAKTNNLNYKTFYPGEDYYDFIKRL